MFESVDLIFNGVDAVSGFYFYSSGVFFDPTCSSARTAGNHAVVVVGFGTDPAYGDYWLIRNSWGRSYLINDLISLLVFNVTQGYFGARLDMDEWRGTKAIIAESLIR